MRTTVKSLMIAVATLAPTFTQFGCDDTVSEKTSTDRRSDGTVVKEKEKTTVDHNDGSVKQSTERSVDKSDSVNR